MPSHYIHIPVLILCASLILSVVGTFTAINSGHLNILKF